MEAPYPYLKSSVELIHQSRKEVKRVLLFTNVHILPPQLEYFPEMGWLEVLQLALHQVAKDVLNFIENTVTT